MRGREMNEINELVAQLAVRRRNAERIKAKIRALESKIADTKEGQELALCMAALSNCNDQEKLADNFVRSAAVSAYEQHGEKKPHPAITGKMFTIAECDNPDALFVYCLHNLTGALKLDMPIIKKLVQIVELPGVRVEQEFRPQIARDLSKWLPADIKNIMDGEES